MATKICIVEDDYPIAAMYEFKLTQSGYEVKLARNGEAGLALIESMRPNLVLLDIKMPVMNGDEMLERLRATDWGSSIRVIVLTNISKDEAPQKLRFLNVDGYIVKAHNTPHQVVELIKSVLK